MNILVLVFNRVYFILQKVGNQSAFLGAVILVTILITSMILSISLGAFAFKEKALHITSGIYFIVIFSVFTFLYLFANKYKEKIIYCEDAPRVRNIYVLFLYIVALGTFVFLSNINRQKLKDTKLQNNAKQSLESKIRKWLD